MMRERGFRKEKGKGVWQRAREKLALGRGMTMAEMLIVVALTLILCGVGFVALNYHRRSLAQLERDGIARELFVAAQNHLTAAKGEGYLGVSQYGTKGTAEGDEEKKVYYYVVESGREAPSTGMFDLMLPFGAVDETVRSGGSYLVRYQPENAAVLDVFYCTLKDSPDVFNHTLQSSEYGKALGLAGNDRDKRSGRRTYQPDKSVLGWYGGTDAESLPTVTLDAPSILVTNGEKLTVTVSNPNSAVPGASLTLILTGKLSGAKKAFPLSSGGSDGRVTREDSGGYTVILDDITAPDLHFCDIDSDTADPFIPGEDVEIFAVAYSNTALANIAYSAKKTENSLFSSVGGNETAYISHIRHLENLHAGISGLDENDTENLLDITDAIQNADLSWTDFLSACDGENTKVYGNTNGSLSGEATEEGCFMPVNPEAALSYDGQNHSIRDISVKLEEAGSEAGLFGALKEGSSLKNLELLDFSIQGQGPSGALAGKLTDTQVKNILVRSSADSEEPAAVTSSAGPAGGLIGVMDRGTMEACGAAALVAGQSSAGGLAGKAQDAQIRYSWSGGHTLNGSYEERIEAGNPYDVTASGSSGTAGGLVGDAGDSSVTGCYSTCSVDGSVSGGLLGSADGTVSGSYAAGLVRRTESAGAFLGSGSAALSGNAYYSIVNPLLNARPGAAESEGVSALDADAAAYEAFVGSEDTWEPANAYDPVLRKEYGGRYPLKSAAELAGSSWPEDAHLAECHWGDWPAPEIFIFNTPK